MSDRIDYDEVAPSYDAQPYRQKGVDPDLVEFLDGRASAVRVLDVACGTGNQIAVNRSAFEEVEFVGLDASEGMLEVARQKANDVTWVRGSADALPFDDQSFDYVSCQFAYHHFPDRPASFREAFRVLRQGGRFVLTNVAPHEYRDAAFYRMFPSSFELDARHFLPTDELTELLERCGFEVSTSIRTTSDPSTWGELLDYVSVRTNNSHLTAMEDAAYVEGLQRIENEVALRGREAPVHNPVVIARFVANRRG